MNRSLIRSAVLAFVLSRALFFAIAIVGSQSAFIGKAYSGSVWQTRIELARGRIAPELIRVSMIGDAWFYRSIAADGYADANHPIHDWAFFPVFPLLVRMFRITGDFALNGMLLSNLLFAGALLLMADVGIHRGLDEETVRRSLWYMAFFPTAYFFSLPLPESTFLALSLASVAAAHRGRFLLSGVLGGGAAATRFVGVLLLPLLLFLWWRRGRESRFGYVGALLVPLGTAAFMTFLHFRAGDALAFVHVQAGWGRTPAMIWTPISTYLRQPWIVGDSWNLIVFNFLAAVLLLTIGVVFCVRGEWDFASYTLGSALLPLASGSLQSIGRYAIVVFPAFLFLGILGRRRSVDQALIAGFATLFGCFTILFVAHIDIALA